MVPSVSEHLRSTEGRQKVGRETARRIIICKEEPVCGAPQLNKATVLIQFVWHIK